MFAMLLAAATPAAAVPQTDFLAGIRAGKQLCSNPDPVNKSCSTIDSFTKAADGTLTDTGETLLAAEPPVTLETSSIAHIDGATNCGMMDMADLQKGRLRVMGQLLPPDQNAVAIAKIAEKLAFIAGHKACETLHSNGGKLTKSAHIEGLDAKIEDKPVAWIVPGDGYKVAAPSAPVPAVATQ